jgi:hypothetical protein
VSTDVVGTSTGQQYDIVVKEEEQILRSVPIEEHPVELLTKWEFDLRELEDWLDSLQPEGEFHKIAMLGETHKH